MAFCFVSGSCIHSALEAVIVILHLALEARAILVVPSATDVLRDYLNLCMFAQPMFQR